MRTTLCAVLAGGALGSSAAGQLTKMVVYGDTTTNIPRYRTWSGSAWSNETATLDVGGSPRWVIAKNCPTRTELLLAVGDNQNDLNVMKFDGTTWGGLIEANANIATDTDRPFYLAYEQVSGDGLLAYRVGNTSSTLYYRTWNGSSWSAESSASYGGSGAPRYVKMVPKPGSNEIMTLILDSKKDVSALVWNGSAFGNGNLLDNNAQSAGNELMDAAYEGLSGRCMVIWSVKNSGTPSYKIWSGGSWGSELFLPNIGAKNDWDRLTSDPASNKMIAAFLDKNSDVNAVVWNGSAWGSVTEFVVSSPSTDRRDYDIAFEPDGTRALAMYAKSSLNTPFYRTFDGTTWSAEQTGPDISNVPGVVQFSPLGSGREILIGIERKNDGSFTVMRWTGTSLANTQQLASDLGGPNGNECFMFSEAGTAGAAAKRITSWIEASPNP